MYMLFNTRCNINMFLKRINTYTCHLTCFDEQCFFRQVGSQQQLIHHTLGSSSYITHSMLGMTAYRIWSPSHATQTLRRPCSIMCKFFAHCLRPCKLNLHTRISTIGSKRNWVETLSCSQRNPTNFLQWWIR